ncbi:hypothetical protein GCM10017764_08780 [Sphingobacterium griseoflavum]|uniref:Uncharacterized protein n=1 Tax=Sphingobacterium griseoflavum TaxID=1474952 RepID=A0ABQ3HV94_9SPHI|nr:hypothetical protein GCM10017764_08780 [Sphingobacterium griseoflavum]
MVRESKKVVFITSILKLSKIYEKIVSKNFILQTLDGVPANLSQNFGTILG